MRGRSFYLFAFAGFALLSVMLLLVANQNQVIQVNIQVFNPLDFLVNSNSSNLPDAPSPSPSPKSSESNAVGAGLPGDNNAELSPSGAPTPVAMESPTPNVAPSTAAVGTGTDADSRSVTEAHINVSNPEVTRPGPDKGGALSHELLIPNETGAPGDCTILILYNGGFPPFLMHTLSQIRCWNPASECALWLVGNQSSIDKFMTEDLKEKKDEFDLHIGILEDLEMTEDYWYFTQNTPLIAQGAFWVRATTRCFFIEAAMRKYELTDVAYFETDVMMYFSVRNFVPLFRSLVKRFAVTPTSKRQFTLGVTFIRTAEDMREFNHFQRTNYTTKRGGWEPAEMEQLVDFKKQLGDDYLYTFPTLPYTTKDDSINKVAFDTEHVFPPNIVFDAASWGQYYGGTPNGHEPGYNSNKHYVGTQLKAGCCSMRWEREKDTGRWYPVVEWKNPLNETEAGSSKIMDLHIHSKQKKYMMNSCSDDGKPIEFVPLPADS